MYVVEPLLHCETTGALKMQNSDISRFHHAPTSRMPHACTYHHDLLLIDTPIANYYLLPARHRWCARSYELPRAPASRRGANIVTKTPDLQHREGASGRTSHHMDVSLQLCSVLAVSSMSCALCISQHPPLELPPSSSHHAGGGHEQNVAKHARPSPTGRQSAVGRRRQLQNAAAHLAPLVTYGERRRQRVHTPP